MAKSRRAACRRKGGRQAAGMEMQHRQRVTEGRDAGRGRQAGDRAEAQHPRVKGARTSRTTTTRGLGTAASRNRPGRLTRLRCAPHLRQARRSPRVSAGRAQFFQLLPPGTNGGTRPIHRWPTDTRRMMHPCILRCPTVTRRMILSRISDMGTGHTVHLWDGEASSTQPRTHTRQDGIRGGTGAEGRTWVREQERNQEKEKGTAGTKTHGRHGRRIQCPFWADTDTTARQAET